MILSAMLAVWLFMTIIWVISIIIKNVSIVDTIFSINYILIHLAYLYHKTPDIIDACLFLATLIWAIRLSLHIGIKNIGLGEEKRYQRFRENYGKERYWWFSYFQVFILQGAFLLIFASPIHISYYTPLNNPIYPLAIIGFLLFLFGFLYETIADLQLYRFKQQNDHTAFLSSGLWRYSRHPNYFGELCLWFGLGLAAFAKAPSLFALISFIGPIFQTYVMSQLSGPKNHEPHMLKEKPGFKDYQDSTPTIIPNFLK